eukprot:TRINITY_DN20722_c0_g1_i1.p1 TRINITY_DN20722_c0_g1~~TRINITY_DN20722_c0_g1_i1.p1  ORF type:complete len:581 (-),score=127.30 TRINITY_DN20722_c0_g1_i1:361-2103(-)
MLSAELDQMGCSEESVNSSSPDVARKKLQGAFRKIASKFLEKGRQPIDERRKAMLEQKAQLIAKRLELRSNFVEDAEKEETVVFEEGRHHLLEPVVIEVVRRLGDTILQTDSTTMKGRLTDTAKAGGVRVKTDFQKLAAVSDAAADLMFIFDGEISLLFTDEETREAFQKIETAFLSYAYHSATVPPWNCKNVEQDETVRPFVCDLCEQQEVRFETRKKLLTHAQTVHKIRNLASLLANTNQCPWCKPTCSIQDMFCTGECPVDWSCVHTCLPVIVPDSLTCPFCRLDHEELADLQRHINGRSHLQPQTITVTFQPSSQLLQAATANSPDAGESWLDDAQEEQGQSAGQCSLGRKKEGKACIKGVFIKFRSTDFSQSGHKAQLTDKPADEGGHRSYFRHLDGGSSSCLLSGSTGGWETICSIGQREQVRAQLGQSTCAQISRVPAGFVVDGGTKGPSQQSAADSGAFGVNEDNGRGCSLHQVIQGDSSLLQGGEYKDDEGDTALLFHRPGTSRGSSEANSEQSEKTGAASTRDIGKVDPAALGQGRVKQVLAQVRTQVQQLLECKGKESRGAEAEVTSID